MIIYYNTITEELKNKIRNKDLDDEELKDVKNTLYRDYPSFRKNKRKANIALTLCLVSVLVIVSLFFIFINKNALIFVEAGSETAKMIVFILVGFCILFVISIIIAAVYSLKYLAYTHAAHLYKEMKKNYPKQLELWNL